MLILSRKAGDAVVIDGGIRVVVIACDRRGVRLGIEAPSHVSIVREEIVAQVADENRRATAPVAPGWLQPTTPTGPLPGVIPGTVRGPEETPPQAQESQRSRR